MKKIIEFFETYGLWLIIAVLIIAFIVCLALPYAIAIGRNLWDIALNNPTAVM